MRGRVRSDIQFMRVAERNLPTEEQIVRIRVIDAFDSLGYRGVGREEHSGENAPRDPKDLLEELADNVTASSYCRPGSGRSVC